MQTLVLTSILAVAAAASPPKPAPPKTPKTLPTSAPKPVAPPQSKADPDSLLQRSLDFRPSATKGTLARFATRKVEIAPGVERSLSTIAAGLFSEQEKFERALRTAPSGELFAPVKTETEVFDFGDSYVIVRRTSTVVAKPDELRKRSKFFRQGVTKRNGSVPMAKMSKASRAGFEAFKRELAKEPASHPLRKAAAKGDQALLNAIADGVGPIEIEDTIHIPKKLPRLKGSKLSVPRLDGERLDYARPGTMKLSTAITGLGNGPVVAPNIAEQVGEITSERFMGGRVGTTAAFLAGQTWADSWRWERKWKVPSGFFRITLGAYYAVGLRIPIEMQTSYYPTLACESGGHHATMEVYPSLRVKADTKDAGPEFYERAGLSGAAVADGKEFVLEAGVGYGYKLRLFWETLVHKRYTVREVDYGQHFEPPLSTRSKRVKSFFLPASLTHTELGAGPLSGKAQIGLRLEAEGTVATRVAGYQNGRPAPVREAPQGSTPTGSGRTTSKAHRLLIGDHDWKEYEFRLLAHGRPRHNRPQPDFTDTYGFKVDDVGYESDWSVVPGVKVSASASYHGYGIRVAYSFWLSSLRLPIGEVTLHHHPGTTRAIEYQDGHRYWHRNNPGESGWCRERQQ
jgi:hypothetical protein